MEGVFYWKIRLCYNLVYMETGERTFPPGKSRIKETHNVGGLNFVVSLSEFRPKRPTNTNSAAIFIPGWSIDDNAPTVKGICEPLAQNSGAPIFAVKARAERAVKGYLPGGAEAIRRTVEQVIEKEGIKSLTVMGNSEGGAEAIALVARLQKLNPNIKIDGLILFDSVSLYNQHDTNFLRLYLEDIVKTTTASSRRKIKPNAVYAASGAFGIVREFVHSRPLGFIKRSGREIREMAKESPYLSEVHVPVIIVQGKDDVISNPSKTTSDVFPNSPWVNKITAEEWSLHNAAFVTPKIVAEALASLKTHNQTQTKALNL